MRRFAGPRRPAVVAHVADDHRAVTDLHLGAMVLADPHPLGESERLRQPGDRLAYIRIDEHGNDRSGRDRAVQLHYTSLDPRRMRSLERGNPLGTDAERPVQSQCTCTTL